MGDKGFSMTELMVAMTILAVGLLSLAQLQIIAMQGTAASRQFSMATNLARETVESAKITGIYILVGTTANVNNAVLYDNNTGNNDDDGHAPAITTDTDIAADLKYDTIEVIDQDPDTGAITTLCSAQSPANCDATINAGGWEFVRITNVRNIPPGKPDGESVMKDVNVIVLWKDRAMTRSVNLRTIVARKDNDFF